MNDENANIGANDEGSAGAGTPTMVKPTPPTPHPRHVRRLPFDRPADEEPPSPSPSRVRRPLGTLGLGGRPVSRPRSSLRESLTAYDLGADEEEEEEGEGGGLQQGRQEQFRQLVYPADVHQEEPAPPSPPSPHPRHVYDIHTLPTTHTHAHSPSATFHSPSSSEGSADSAVSPTPTPAKFRRPLGGLPLPSKARMRMSDPYSFTRGRIPALTAPPRSALHPRLSAPSSLRPRLGRQSVGPPPRPPKSPRPTHVRTLSRPANTPELLATPTPLRPRRSAGGGTRASLGLGRRASTYEPVGSVGTGAYGDVDGGFAAQSTPLPARRGFRPTGREVLGRHTRLVVDGKRTEASPLPPSSPPLPSSSYENRFGAGAGVAAVKELGDDKGNVYFSRDAYEDAENTRSAFDAAYSGEVGSVPKLEKHESAGDLFGILATERRLQVMRESVPASASSSIKVKGEPRSHSQKPVGMSTNKGKGKAKETLTPTPRQPAHRGRGRVPLGTITVAPVTESSTEAGRGASRFPTPDSAEDLAPSTSAAAAARDRHLGETLPDNEHDIDDMYLDATFGEDDAGIDAVRVDRIEDENKREETGTQEGQEFDDNDDEIDAFQYVLSSQADVEHLIELGDTDAVEERLFADESASGNEELQYADAEEQENENASVDDKENAPPSLPPPSASRAPLLALALRSSGGIADPTPSDDADTEEARPPPEPLTERKPPPTPHKLHTVRKHYSSPAALSASGDSEDGSGREESLSPTARRASAIFLRRTSVQPVREVGAAQEEYEEEESEPPTPVPAARTRKRKRQGENEKDEDPMTATRNLEKLLPRRPVKRSAASPTRARGRGRGRARGRGRGGEARAVQDKEGSFKEGDDASENEENHARRGKPRSRASTSNSRGRGAARGRGRGSTSLKPESTSNARSTQAGRSTSRTQGLGKGKKRARDEGEEIDPEDDEERARARQTRLEYFQMLDKEYSLEKEDVYVI
ncbi:hypothetical protein WOLCODRAFT_140074 [Wolfiporia cocos MD-104 SS10]|uniref:Uncharacterized protein n=1 Tax=Wolfiporia cocos (strain MD-104) TaxID=742152 RepID=A0A2H3JIE4_WOLCO|nr:hypothetical protein WOLCODRAFT_140074 [Wolfiporia cocos MD-104 SS10]